MNEFRAGRSHIEVKPKASRNVTNTDDYNTKQVKKLLNSDRRMTCEEMFQKLELAQFLGSRLGMWKVSALWVPHHLTPEQAYICLTIPKLPFCFFHLMQTANTSYQKFLR